MDVELLKSGFQRLLNSGISEPAVLRNYPAADGESEIHLAVTWQNLKAEEVRGLYGFSSPYAGSVITTDIPGVRRLSSSQIRELYMEIDGEEFDVLSILPVQGVGVRFDLTKKVKR